MMSRYSTQHVCPECGHSMGMRNIDNEGQPPRPGDVSLCGSCAVLLEFTDGSSQLVAVPPEVQDQMLRYLCTEDTNSADQADKLYRGYLHLKEALTR